MKVFDILSGVFVDSEKETQRSQFSPKRKPETPGEIYITHDKVFCGLWNAVADPETTLTDEEATVWKMEPGTTRQQAIQYASLYCGDWEAEEFWEYTPAWVARGSSPEDVVKLLSEKDTSAPPEGNP